MSSDAFEQFAKEFGCWITDHGVTGIHGGRITDGIWEATIHLPTLEAAIKDLITEARALVAAETLTQLDHAASRVGGNRNATGMIRWALEPVRAELAEIASPGGECAECGHISQPEYRHGTTDHVRDHGAELRDLQRRTTRLEVLLGGLLGRQP
jgi:hypothetical protein